MEKNNFLTFFLMKGLVVNAWKKEEMSSSPKRSFYGTEQYFLRSRLLVFLHCLLTSLIFLKN